MMDVDNTYGRQRKCHCGEKETTGHVIQCKQMGGGVVERVVRRNGRYRDNKNVNR